VENPRVTDVFGIDLRQEDAGFIIPKVEEDIPLYVDPFLFWNSELVAYKNLHFELIAFFSLVRNAVVRSDITAAAALLAGISEPIEMGLGYATGSKCGSSLGPVLIGNIVDAFERIPQLTDGKLRHVEELQMVVPKIAEDRVSDIAVSVLKHFFLSYTVEQAKIHNFPCRELQLRNDMFDLGSGRWVPPPKSPLPFNPKTGEPILLSPANLLRYLPWINYEGYYKSSFAKEVLPSRAQQMRAAKPVVLAYNARNYHQVERYVADREAQGDKCRPDPIFNPITTGAIKAKIARLVKLPTGSMDGADRDFEDLVGATFPSLFWPSLEFAASRVRTLSGVHIRDLIFYNDRKGPFWADMAKRYDCRQLVFELKNVQSLSPEHVDQLYRYLGDEFGRFGVLVSRNPAPPAVLKNTVDLHSAHRVVILCLDDRDVDLMVSLAESGRSPTDAIRKKFVEFTRLLPV
jgi:hypothetical protein